jgi:hypothetical protein
MTTFELTSEEILKPTFEKRDNSPKEEEPHPVTGKVESVPWALADGAGIETMIDDVLQILASPNLAHQPVLVSIHTRQLTDVVEDVVNPVCELEGIDVPETILDMRIDNQLDEPQDFAHQMERVTEPRLFALLGGQRLDWFQVEVVVEMEVCQSLSMDQEIEHIESLTDNLETRFDPIDRSRLEELGRFEGPEETLLVLGFGFLGMEGVENVVLQELLIGYADFDRLIGRTVFKVPLFDEGDILSTDHVPSAFIEWMRGPPESNPVRSIVCVEFDVREKRINISGHLKTIIDIGIPENLIFVRGPFEFRGDESRGNGIDQRIKVECRQLGIVRSNVLGRWIVVPCQMDGSGKRVV